MAIYSLHHSSVGRTTHKAGTAAAHAKYILRIGADAVALGEHMPTGKHAAAAWLLSEELADRKNARVIDKVMVALPFELSTEERKELVRSFVQEIGNGQIPWIAAIHQEGEDEHNPHAHIVIRDRHIVTGKRVAKLSEKGSTEFIRWLWEQKANEALANSGHEARIDRRSLKDQGIRRRPQIHVGPNAEAIAKKGIRPGSVRLRIGDRVIDYPEIDQGLNRSEYNTAIIRQNNEKSLEVQLESVQARIAGLTNEMELAAALAENSGLIPEALKVKIRVMIEQAAAFFRFKQTAQKLQEKRERQEQAARMQAQRQVYLVELQRREYALAQEIRKEEERRAARWALYSNVQNMRFPAGQQIMVNISLKDQFPEKAFVARLEALPTTTLQKAVKTSRKHTGTAYSASNLRQDTLAVKELLKRDRSRYSPLKENPVVQQAGKVKMRVQASESFKTAQNIKMRKRRRRKRD